MVEFRLLGPVQVLGDQHPIEVGEPRRRAVLAALLVDAGQVVPSATLVDRVWGQDPPAQVHKTLGSHITRIRRVLELAGGTATVVNEHGGYRLSAQRDLVDLHRFRLLSERAREAEGSDARRAELLRQALELWHGEALAGVPGEWAQRTRERLGQDRLETAAAWAEAELTVGNPAAVLAPLAELAEAHPLMEPFTLLLMRALAAAGRPTEALERCRAHQEHLADTYGTDQGPELRALYERILRGQADPAPVAARQPPLAPAPAQLPADVHGFAGRRDHLTLLDKVLDEAAQGAAPTVVAISGSAGVGKTALAVHWAHAVADQFPDGQLYLNLHGFDLDGAVLDPAEAVRRLLDALGVAPARVPADLDACASLYRSLLAGRRMLILLDNARDSAQVYPLLPGTGSCLVMVTSRTQLTSLVAAGNTSPVSLALFTEDEARELLSRRLGPERVAAEPEATAELVARCARLPIALVLVAAHAALRPGAQLRALADDLRHTRWESLSGDDPATDLRAVFSWSYRTLSPATARLFRLLGLHPDGELSGSAAASLAGMPPAGARAPLRELVRANLLTEQAPGRYGLHDLLHAYAGELCGAHDPEDERRAATNRLLDHYLHTAAAADRVLVPLRPPIELPAPQPGVTVDPPADREQALDWFARNRASLLTAVDHAVRSGFDGYAYWLAWSLSSFLDRQAHWREWARIARCAEAVARRRHDRAAEADCVRMQGVASVRLGRVEEAHDVLHRALDQYRQLDDRLGQAYVHNHLASVWARRGDHGRALRHVHQSADLYRAVGNRRGQAYSLNDIGWFSALLGEYEQTVHFCQAALVLLEELDDRSCQANTWDSLGYAYQHMGRHDDAVDSYRRALQLAREVKDPCDEAEILVHLGDTHLAVGDIPAARRAWQQALRFLDGSDHVDAPSVRARLDDLDRRAAG